MKYFFSSLIALSTTLLYAQNVYFQPVPSLYPLNGTTMKNAGIKQYEKTSYRKNGQLRYTTVYHLSRNGNTQAILYYDNHQKITSQSRYTYAADSLLESYLSCNAKGDTLSYYHYQYNENGKPIKLHVQYKKRKTTYLYHYNTEHRLIETILLVKGQQKWRYVYEYNAEGQRSRSLYYNANNQLKRQTTYQCDYRGTTEHQKAITTTNVCKRTDALPDGGYAVYQEFTDKKMRQTRTVYTYNADSNLLKWETFNHDNRMISRTEYTYDQAGNCTLGTFFNKDNKVSFSMQSTYNDKKLPVSVTTGKPGKPLKREAFNYQFYQ